MNKRLIEILSDMAGALTKNQEAIEFLMKEHIESMKLIGRLADALLVQQTRIELLNKAMLDFIPDENRRGNQLIQ